MIVVIRQGVAPVAVASVLSRIEELGFRAQQIHDGDKILLAAVSLSDTNEFAAAEQLRAFEWVEEVHLEGKPYRLVARNGHPAGSVIDVGGVGIGGEEIVLMAGPCTVESEDLLMVTAEAVARAGAKFLRGGAYKPSTSPYSFQGLGVPGLELLQRAGKRYGLKVVTEVMDPRKVEVVARYAHMLQIGTRNMQNYDLLREVGLSGVPVLLKRGMSAKIEEWLLAAEYIAAAGNDKIVLCERGIRSFDSASRNTLDLAAVPIVKGLSHLPVIVDPSQGTGRRDLIAPMSKAAIACGADGLIIEVHSSPDLAIKDGGQSITCETFDTLAGELGAVARAVGRRFAAPSPSRR